MISTGQRIKELRNEKKLFQKELAFKIGTAQTTISQWEQGKQDPTIIQLIILADYFEVSLDYLMGRSDDFGRVVAKDPTLTDEESELLYVFRNITRGDRNAILSIVQTYKLKIQTQYA